jgi:hypothetical protein
MFPSGREHEFASKNHYRLIVYRKGFEPQNTGMTMIDI